MTKSMAPSDAQLYAVMRMVFGSTFLFKQIQGGGIWSVDDVRPVGQGA